MEENITEYKDILTIVHLKIAIRLLPVTVILYLLIIIGIFGNIATIAFYVQLSIRKSSYLLITSMAFADLGTCLAAILVFTEMPINVKYSYAFLCKFSHFFGLWAGACATLLLGLISFDRYRKICKPLGKQMTFATLKYLVIGITAFSFLFSVRLFVTYNIVNVDVQAEDANTTITGLHCAKLSIDHPMSLFFYSIEFLIMFVVLITVIVTYSRIIYAIVKRRLYLTKLSAQNKNFVLQRNGLTEMNIRKQQPTLGNMVTEKGRKLHDTELGDISISEIRTNNKELRSVANCNKVQKDVQSSSEDKPQKTTFDYSNIRNPSEVKLTLMMCVVSVIFILCFTPYFVIHIFIRMVMEYEIEYDFSALIQFALKFPYVNSSFNPIIYFIFNPQLRRYFVTCFTKCRSKM